MFLLNIMDSDGDENFNVDGLDPPAKPGADGVPPVKISRIARESARPSTSCRGRSRTSSFVGLNDRDKAWHELYQLQLSTGKMTLLRNNTDRITEWGFDN